MFWNSGKKPKSNEEAEAQSKTGAKKLTTFEQKRKAAESAVQEINEKLGILSEEERKVYQEEQEFYARDNKLAVTLNRGGLAESKPVVLSGELKQTKNESDVTNETSKAKLEKSGVVPALRRPF